jgi:outer membrane protein OmpA-like peptidoglycan-associated protein
MRFFNCVSLKCHLFRDTMHKFFRLIILFVLLLPIKGHSQQSSDTVLIIYFKSGKYITGIKDERKILDAMNDRNKLLQIKEISSYTDSVGTVQDNMLLAQKRSENVIELLNRHSLLTGDYKINIYGEQKPISYTNISLNRRVEIFFSLSKRNVVFSDTSKFKIIQKLELKDLYFKPDEPVLEPSSMPYLDYIANILKTDLKDIFEIKGHVNWNPRSSTISDSGYRSKMNRLSADRAKLIYEILIDKGIPLDRMFWKGMGNTEMIFPNASTDEEKRKNMRVEILILKNPAN